MEYLTDQLLHVLVLGGDNELCDLALGLSVEVDHLGDVVELLVFGDDHLDKHVVDLLEAVD
jgi:hypothetical protein